MVKISDQIRQEIESSGMTRYRISKLTGVAQSTLSRFMSGGEMSTAVLDRVADVLRLTIGPVKRRQVSKRSSRSKTTKARKTKGR